MQPASNVIAIHPAFNSESTAAVDGSAPDERGRTSERAMWWFKLTNDCTRDPLIRTIARRSGQPLERVFAVMVALQAEASGAKDRGSVVGFDAETVGDAFDVAEGDIAAIVQALTDRGWIADGRIAEWEKMQPARDEQKSTSRVRECRERKAAAKRDETSVKRQETPGNALESESESELELFGQTPQKASNATCEPAGERDSFDLLAL